MANVGHFTVSRSASDLHLCGLTNLMQVLSVAGNHHNIHGVTAMSQPEEWDSFTPPYSLALTIFLFIVLALSKLCPSRKAKALHTHGW